MSSTYYSKAPITEALIDLRVVLPSSVAAVDIAAGLKSLQGEYPIRQEIPSPQQIQFNFDKDMLPAVTVSPLVSGFRYVSNDQKRIIQARTDAFVFSILPPYDTWEAFRDAAKAAWNIYSEAAKPTQVQRIAVRYVNQLRLPGGSLQLQEYIQTYPEVSIRMEYAAIAAYQMRVFLPQPDLGGMLVLTQEIIPPSEPEYTSLLIDIDLFCEKGDWKSDEDIWAFLERLRLRKNEVFEATITEKTKELIR